jgi:lipoprotein-releasing system ATP-binding protein
MNDASTTTFHAPVATASNPLAEDQEAPVLFLHGVTRTYSQGSAALEVLKSAELALWPGQSVALVAPSGAGKSTLLHVAGLLEHPDAGEVYVDKIPTSRMADS